jgi:hypothetical protein
VQYGLTHYADCIPVGVKNVADLPGSPGRRPKDALASLQELFAAEQVADRVKRRADRYKKVRLSRPRNHPRKRLRGSPLFLDVDQLDWTRKGKGWGLRTPIGTAWRRECRECDAAREYAAALDSAGSDRQAALKARRARSKWDRHVDTLRRRVNDRRRATTKKLALLRTDLQEGRRYLSPRSARKPPRSA